MNVNKIKLFIKANIFPILLVIITLLICSANYQEGTILSGWDTLHPEFNFPEYFKRIFFGVWQEHQGLGALATQAHASEIARMFIYFPLSFFLPENFLRYSYFFLTIILGPLGIYFLIIKKVLPGKTLANEVSAFLGGLFYLLNLGTLQHFYVPFEMFATHFATLPWLFLLAIDYLEKRSIKTLLIFYIVSFLSASMAHTSTLWFAFLGGFLIFLTTYILFRKNYREDLKSLLIIIIIFLLANTFWLLPNLYFLINQGDSISNSKIHSLFSEEAFAQNQAFGNIKDVLIFKNFLFNWGEYIGENKFDYLLNEWNIHLKNPVVLLIGYLFALISLIGIIFAILKKNKIAISLLTLLLFSYFFWFNANPPVGFIYDFLRENIPLFKEAFRFPFTKFSIFLVFCMSIYFSLGISLIIKLLSRFRGQKIVSYYVLFIVVTALIYYMLPAFKGNFISPSMKVKIPQNYEQVFEWFENESSGRVANLPIHSFWGWIYYDWQYQGAGFLWFGIKQPLLDREFDRWGKFNEQYYREMSQAVYLKNQKLFDNVIKKYDISYLFVDRSVIAPGPGADPKILFVNEISDLLNKSSLLKDENDFGPISLYKTKSPPDSLYLLKNAKSVSPQVSAFYEDFIFEKYSDYITSDGALLNFPFMELINNQNQLIKNPELTQEGFVFKLQNNSNAKLPGLAKIEDNVLADLFVSKNQSSIDIFFYPKFPDQISQTPIRLNFPGRIDEFMLSVNQKYNFRVGELEQNTSYSLGQVELDLSSDNPIQIYPVTADAVLKPNIFELDYSIFQCGAYDKTPVFGINPNAPNSFSFFADHAQACMRFLLAEKPEDLKLGKQNQNILVNVNYDFGGENSPNLCLVKKDDSSCIYYFQRNLDSNNFSSKIFNQYYSIKNNELSDFEIKIFLDSTDLKSSKRVDYENLTFSFTKPLFETEITKSELINFINQNQPKDNKPNEITIPFSGNENLSRDITTLPKTGGDCPALNPRGPAPTSREVVKTPYSDFIRYVSDDGSFCDHFSYQGLSSNQGYLISIRSRNIKGLPIRLCIANLTSKRCDIYTHLPKNKDFATDNFILPSIGDEKGFDININNFAIKGATSINDIASINVVPIPYNYLSQIETNSTNLDKSERIKVGPISHPNSSLYKVSNVDSKDGQTLVLSQSFDKGWQAYSINHQSRAINQLSQIFPFIFGKRIDNHVMVNNWANGWTLEPNHKSSIIVIYLPQHLEYIGIILTIGTFIALLVLILRKKNRRG